MNLPELIERFGSEDKCRAYLEELRWPDGVKCPRCMHDKISRIAKRKQYECAKCRYQFSVTARTIMHDSHLPLWKWFLAIYLIVESKKGISSKQLQRMLMVSYKTAWYLSHRIRDAMGDAEQPPLEGIIEVDETFVGGEKKGVGSGGYQRISPLVVGAAERRGQMRLRVVGNRQGKTLVSFLTDVVSSDALAIHTDEHGGHVEVDQIAPHETVGHGRGELFAPTSSTRHLPAYLDEMEWRYNRRNPFLFRDTVLQLVGADALPYKRACR
jgi:transposase-like protein